MEANELIMAEAIKHKGTWEWAGEEHNPKVLAMYADAGHPEIRKDEVPWCAAFVGAVLARCGINNTGSLLARSYLDWGEKVDGITNAMPGDVLIFSRGTSSWQGHVGFLYNRKGDRVGVLGGNQGNQVNVRMYPVEKLLGIRRAKKPKTSLAKSTTVGASGVGAVAAATSGVTAVSSLSDTTQIVVAVAAVVALLAFAWIFRERIKKFAEGVR